MNSELTIDIAAPKRWSPFAWLEMGDYTPKAKVYWSATVLLGTAILGASIVQVAGMDRAAITQIVLGVLVAAFIGAFPVRIPHSKNSLAAGEIFIFLLLLTLGPAPATVAAAGEAAIASARTSRRWSSRIASPAMAAIAMGACGGAFHSVVAWLGDGAGLLVLALTIMSVAYYACVALLTTTVISLKCGESLRPFAVLARLGWVGVAYAGSASIAALLYLTSRQLGVGVLVAAVPIIAMFLVTLHHYFTRHEAEERVRAERVDAAEREAALAAAHVRQLAESERRFHSAFTHASIGMALVAFDGRVRQANDALRALLDLDAAQMIDRPFRDFVYVEDQPALAALFADVEARRSDAFALELRCRHRAGHEVWVALHGSFFADMGAAEPCLILQAQNVSSRRLAEDRLHHIAFHDGLTGLPNRSRFRENLEQAIQLVRASPRQQFAVMFLDFDRFKLINDSMGHGAGDAFLVEVTRRIRENVRPADVVARLGGDEFAILCEGIERRESAIELAERLQRVLQEPLQIDGNALVTSASIGITFSSVGYESPEEVLRDADIAMYRAKNSGKARYALFDADLRTQVSERVDLERDLRRAIGTGELFLAYQPILELGTGRLKGFEALVRWIHPERGTIAPDVFIPLAEEAGLMLPISDFVLNRACRQLADWQRKSGQFADLRMHVNLSAADLAQPGLVDRVRRAVTGSWILPQHLTLELTENILMKGMEDGIQGLERLRALGVSVSVDDFGTGYSSLSHLTMLPIDSLKIDRSFVRGLREDSKEAAVVRSVISLGNSLGKAVIAEGIETPEQLDQLHAAGCRFGQGHHLSEPIPPERVDSMLDGIDMTFRSLAPARFDAEAVRLVH